MSVTRHDWFQNVEKLTLTIYQKNVAISDVAATADLTSVSSIIKFKSISNNLILFKDPCEYHKKRWTTEIVPESLSFTVYSTKLEFVVEKAHSGTWSAIEQGSSPEESLII